MQNRANVNVSLSFDQYIKFDMNNGKGDLLWEEL